MKRVFLIITILFSSIYADTYLYIEQDNNGGSYAYCIDSYYFDSGRLYFHDTLDDRNRNIRTRDYSKIDFTYGYTVENGVCEIITETDLNQINIDDTYIYFGSLLLFFASLWGIKKAVSFV